MKAEAPTRPKPKRQPTRGDVLSADCPSRVVLNHVTNRWGGLVLLRNGWYTENYTAGVPAALQYGAVLGSAGDGKISSAARADYAVAAAAVLSLDDQAGRVYELAGDEAYTLSELAAEIARQAGQPVVYRDLPEAAYEAALLQAGLPGFLAAMLAESDVGAAKGGLFDDGRELSRLIGRSTTPLADVVKAALSA